MKKNDNSLLNGIPAALVVWIACRDPLLSHTIDVMHKPSGAPAYNGTYSGSSNHIFLDDAVKRLQDSDPISSVTIQGNSGSIRYDFNPPDGTTWQRQAGSGYVAVLSGTGRAIVIADDPSGPIDGIQWL
jgi:hypothetical protein